MVDWTKSMEQSFEYYEVDPATWQDKRRLTNIKSSSITRDSEIDTLGSASIESIDMLGEAYIRIYLITIQNGITERHPLGTYLIQTPQSDFDGKKKNISIDAYTPLIELKENPLQLGYTLLEGENIMENAYQLTKESCRCPVVKTTSERTLDEDFVANSDDVYMTFLIDLIKLAKFRFDTDEMGRILFAPIQKLDSLQPVTTFDDSNSSILHPDVSIKHDIYGIPNVIEVYCTVGDNVLFAKAENNDPNSPTSIESRGRKILQRITNPDLPGIPTQQQIEDYATDILREVNSLSCIVTFTHGYYPVKPGDCVRLDYKKAGLENVKAKIISQSIKCKPGVEVKTTATFIKKLWS